MQIHEKIKQARIKSGLTPEQLAAKIGVPRTTYLYWEDVTPKTARIMDIARALDLPANYFFANNDDEISVKIHNKEGKLAVKGNIKGVNHSGQQVFVDAKDLTASFERIIEAKEQTIAEKEARRQEAAEWAKRAESEKKDLFELFKDYLKEILANSSTSKEAIQNLRTEIIAEHGEMMETLDQIAGNPAGTTAAKAGIVELAHQVQKAKKGKSSQASAGKSGK